MNTVTLTLADIVCSLQESILVARYGRANEDTDNARRSTQEYYRSVAALTPSAVDEVFDVENPDLDIRLRFSLSRLYLVDGLLFRVMLTDAKGFDVRKKWMKTAEERILQVAWWILSRARTVPPKGMRLRLFVQDPKSLTISDAVDYVVPIPDEYEQKQIERSITEYAARLVAALGKADADLPECSPDQMWIGASGVPVKCLSTCRARFHCCQRRRHLSENESLLQRMRKVKIVS